MVVKAEDVWKWDSPKKTVRYNSPGEQMSSGARLSWNPLKVLLYDDLVGVVTSHVTKMAVTPLDPPWPKPFVVRTNHGSVFHTSQVIAKNSLKYYIFYSY